MKYLLIYGFAEGPWMGRMFHQAMQQAGHEAVEQPEQAEVIICHSASCYTPLPPDIQANVLLIGPPYWPGKSLFRRLVHKVSLDMRTSFKEHRCRYWLKKTAWNTVYIVLHPIRSWRLTRGAGKNNFVDAFRELPITVVRNNDDAWSTSEMTQALQPLAHVELVTMPGDHDDCWHNPEPYVSLLQSMKR
jgi:dCTP diphosphatase